MAETKTTKENLEREYTIPLRNKWKRVPRYKRTNKAIKAIKEFLAKHMKIENRDLKKIKIDQYLNEEIWFRGIKKPPARIKVKARKEENGEVRVELFSLPDKLKFKKAQAEKQDATALKILEDKKKAAQPISPLAKKEEKTPTEKEETTTEESNETKEEKKVEEKEKKSAVVQAGEQMEKAAAKQAKHETKRDMKQPKRQQRKALAK